MKTPIVIGILVIIILASAGVYYVWIYGGQRQVVLPALEKESGGLGSELYDKVQSPAEKLPETNPFGSTETNPFGEGSFNPFSGNDYVNPFAQ